MERVKLKMKWNKLSNVMIIFFVFMCGCCPGKGKEEPAKEEQKPSGSVGKETEKAGTGEEGKEVGKTAEESPAKPKKVAKFPDVVKKFHKMTEVQQETFAETFPGTVLSGSGKVFEIEKCGFLDESKLWKKDCYKVTLDKGLPRVCLYFGPKDKEKIAGYKKGQKVTFADCVGISIKNWGFWSTATCDMP
jgi:hypothetical protein